MVTSALTFVRGIMDAWNRGDFDAFSTTWVDGFRLALGSAQAELVEVLGEAPDKAAVTRMRPSSGLAHSLSSAARFRS